MYNAIEWKDEKNNTEMKIQFRKIWLDCCSAIVLKMDEENESETINEQQKWARIHWIRMDSLWMTLFHFPFYFTHSLSLSLFVLLLCRAQ